MVADGLIRVLVADDEAMFRDALKRLIDAEAGLSAVGEAADTMEAARLTRELQPDVVLLDVTSVPDGLEALKAVLASGAARTRVIVLSGADDTEATVRALEAGAYGIVTKGADTGMLFDCIRAVARGQYWLGDRQVGDVINAIRELSQRPEASKKRHPFNLTPRELQIVALVTDGCSNKDIAARCSVREDTVKHHLSSIFGKVGVRSRLELAMFAVQHGIATPRDSVV